jgi:predicted nucleic acid-binding protein
MNFWDSSAILPLLVAESGTAEMRTLYEAHPEMVAWWGAPVECTSALARLEREGKLDATSVGRAQRQLKFLQDQWHEVQPVELVRQTAQRLLRVHPLRAADALQLASAVVVCDHRPQTWGFVCLDDRLSAAAEREGFQLRPGQE